jgi:hypothetical protein
MTVGHRQKRWKSAMSKDGHVLNEGGHSGVG